VLVQHFGYRGSSHRRKGAAGHIIKLFRQCRSPIPVGTRRVFNLFKLFQPALERGGGEAAPCVLLSAMFLLCEYLVLPSMWLGEVYTCPVMSSKCTRSPGSVQVALS
jgi:hypothetical protein